MERSLEAAGSNRSADVPPKTKDSLSKDRNNHSARDINANRQHLRSETENLRQNEARCHHEVSDILLDQSLLCKPLYVHLSRLPKSVVNKYMPRPVRAPGRKKIRRNWWKHGAIVKKNYKRKKLRILPTSKKPQLPADRITGVGALPEAILSSGIKSGPTHSAGEKRVDEINQTKDKECGEIGGFTTHGQTLSGRECELSTTQANEASHSPDQINSPILSMERQTHITKSPDKPPSATEKPNNTPTASLEQDNNTNRKISLRAYKNYENQLIFKNAEKRRLSTDNDPSNERKTYRSKKYKCLATVSSSGREMLAEESNSGISGDDGVFFQHGQILPELKKHDTKSMKSRRKSNRTDLNKAMIVVNRLDNSHSPLVQKWKGKIGLPKVDDALISTVTDLESRVSCLSNDDEAEESRLEKSTSCLDQNVPDEETSDVLTRPQENDAGLLDTSKSMNGTIRTSTCAMLELNRPRTPEGEPIHIETIMCDSNDDEDDDEIIEFLSARRRVRPSIDSSSSEDTSILQEHRKTQSPRINPKTPLVNGSSSEGSHQQRRKTASMSREESRKTPSLRTRRTKDWIDNSNLENKNSREEVRSPPVTRSKSRAANENANYENIFCLNEDLTDQTGEHEPYDPYEPLENHESRENESVSSNGSRENIPNPMVCDISREDDNSLEGVSRVNPNISSIDVIQTECSGDENLASRKLTPLKNAMVVVTRLEEYMDLSGDKEYPCGKLKFKATEKLGFLAYFSQGTAENDDIDSQCDDNELSDPTIDPLETERGLVNQTSSSASPFSRKRVNLEPSTTDSSEKNSQQDAIITRNERLQDQSDHRSQETIESDVEMTLYLDETDNASPESVTCHLSEGIPTDLNSSNDRSTRTPGDPCPEDLDEHCKHCQCEDHQRDNRRLKCQNIAATNKCITCNSLFKDSEQLEQHKTSNAFCNSGFRCTVCKTNFMTLIELAKHRVVCAEKGMQKRNSVDQMTNQESTTESRPAESTMSEPPRSKNKPKKHQNQKNSSKQGRSRPRCRVDNLTCSVCSTSFETRSALSEHIFKHSAEELQEAYRIAKAKAMADSQVASEQRKKNESEKNIDQLTDNQDYGKPTGQDEEEPQKSMANPAQAIVSNAGNIVTTTVSNDSLKEATSAMICLCHRDNDQTPMDKTDLQIEMVLLCKYCQVLFRRRECLEVHYRTSSHCASDRTRERWARLFCANCQLTLNSWADMRCHLEVHARQNAEGTVRFVCNICRVVFVGFGTLFYNHWFNHLKDTMFVAGRYNFPKVSVQPANGSEKLPAGARSDETYIFVAEHVCVSCKKPFSTRFDLDTHTENEGSCKKNNTSLEVGKSQMHTNVPRFSCDVCNLTFSDKKALNDHGRTGHDHRFIHVSSCPSSNNNNFMCTHCSERKNSVSALEEHWKTHLVRNPRSSLVETAKSQSEAAKEPVLVSSSVDDCQILKDRLLNTFTDHANSLSRPRATHEPTVITIEDEDLIPENSASVFQAAIETPIVRNRLGTQESVSMPSISSTVPNSATINSTTLTDLLKKTPLLTKAVENHRAEVRALEDSCENVILSDKTSTNVSASLVLNEPVQKPLERTVDDTNTYSFVLLPNQSSPGSMQMVLGKRRAENAIEKCPNPPTSHPSGEVNDKTTVDGTSGTKATVDEVTTLAGVQKSVINNTIDRCFNIASESNTKGKENNNSSKLVVNDKRNFSSASLLKDQPAIPEIIDIVDEVEELGRETKSKINNEIDSLNKKKGNIGLGKSGNSGSTQLNKDLESMKIDGSPQSMENNRKSNNNSSSSETRSKIENSPIRDRSSFYSRASKASTMSFEEARWKTLTVTNLNENDSAGSHKQGFLRVKNLSELRAVKKHVCLACDARFESHKSLIEHQQVHVCGVHDKDVQYPKGITAALVLPDSSESPKTSTHTLSTATRSISTPPRRLPTIQPSHSSRLIGVLSSRATAETRVPNVVNNNSIRSWIHAGNQQAPVSVPPAETSNTLQNVSILMDLGYQQQMNNPLNNVISPIVISSAGIAQSQDNLAIQQTSVMSSVGSIVIPETNQRLHENRPGTIGFHVLPPMVVLPSSHATKQQQHNFANSTSSSNYLPISASVNHSPLTYQTDGVNKFLCNICHTFRCDTLEAFNSHVTKHYTGWTKSIVTQNSIQPIAAVTTTPSVTIPITTSFTMRQERAPRVMADNITSVTNQTGSSPFNNWTVKDTPQGPLLVTPVPTTINEQTITSFVINNNPSILRPAQPTSNNSPSSNVQIVYRCMICKSALYKNYPPLRNHVILVHGITDFASRDIEKIVQKSYHCTQCPSTTALFDSEEKFRAHVNIIHTHPCPSCRRVFVSFLGLKSHLEHCRVSACNDRNSFGNNC